VKAPLRDLAQVAYLRLGRSALYRAFESATDSEARR
jgi:hypothetical protein